MRLLALTMVLTLACKGKDTSDDTASGDTDTDTDADTDTDDSKTFEDFVNVTDTPTGDFTGFDGYDNNGGWITQNVDTSLQELVPMDGVITDFQEGDPVKDATLQIWYSDQATGAPDVITTSDATDGTVSGFDVYSCKPMALLVSTDPELEETKPTYEVHQTYKYANPLDDEYNSVSTTTYALIPGLLGIDPDPDKGIIAGTAYDVNEDPIQGAQVVVRDSSGNIPSSLTVKYFVEEFPNREQPYTSSDGLWVAINVPAGDWNVEMYVSDGSGGFKEMGATELTVVADSINISSIYTGIGDGVKYHDSCLVK